MSVQEALQDFLNEVEAQTIKEQKEQMFTLLRRFILATPQDESVCVANWAITTDFKSSSETTEPDVGGMTAMTQGLTEIEKFKTLGVLTLTNPMPYTIRILEEGHSQQTPPGTMSAIIAELESELLVK